MFLSSKTTIFIDRDGVINVSPTNRYVLNWDQFYFVEGVLDSFKILSELFDQIVIVTNQRCIGLGLLTENELSLIHNRMRREITNSGGRVDDILFCGDKNYTSINLKPNTGMAFQAKERNPKIDLENAVIIGDSDTDMEFGARLGMLKLKITDSKDFKADVLYFRNLYEAVRYLQENYNQKIGINV